MWDATFLTENDAVLIPFLAAEDESEADVCLNRLFEETAIPQIRRVLSSFLTLSPLEKDDIQSDAQTRVLGKLQNLRAGMRTKNSPTAPLRKFTAYLSTITFNCRRDYLLRKKPEWRRQDNRLTRLLDEQNLAWFVFSDAEETSLFGLKEKSNRRNSIGLEEVVARVRAGRPDHLFLKTQEVVPLILAAADGALTKNELIRAILEITDSARFEEIGVSEEINLPNKNAGNEKLVAERQKKYLRRIWEEIATFPENQRKVLLLSLRESRRTEAVTLLLKKRIVTIREVAEALEVSLEEFSDIFDRLPMSSREIADFLGIEDRGKTSKEQRVDNLRRMARALLRERLEIF